MAELIPFLVLGTTGSDEVPELGGSEAEAVASNILNMQTISNIPRKWGQESTNNVCFQLNMLNL